MKLSTLLPLVLFMRGVFVTSYFKNSPIGTMRVVIFASIFALFIAGTGFSAVYFFYSSAPAPQISGEEDHTQNESGSRGSGPYSDLRGASRKEREEKGRLLSEVLDELKPSERKKLEKLLASNGGLEGFQLGEGLSSTKKRKKWERSEEAGEGRKGKIGKGGKGKNSKEDEIPPLRGGELTLAITSALEEQDMAKIQGLLISELSKDGTHLGPENLPSLLEILNDTDDFGLQLLALTHLERMEVDPNALVDGYVDYLFDADKPQHADEVFKRISEVGGEAGLKGLTELIRESASGKYRERAIEALGNMKDPKGVAVLREGLMKITDPYKTKSYMSALASIGSDSAISLIVDHAVDGNNPYALSAIKRMKNESSGFLADALSPRAHPDFQKAILSSLGQSRLPETVPQLERYLNRADESFQKNAISTLGRYYDKSAAKALETYAATQGPESRLGKLARSYASRVYKNAERYEEGERGRASKANKDADKLRKKERKAERKTSDKSKSKKKNK